MLIDTAVIKESANNKDKHPAVWLDDTSNEHFRLLLKKSDKIAQVFGKLKQEVTYHFATAGRWSQYELLNYVLTQTGPAAVYLTTWKINDLVAANLFKSVKSGLITELHTILEKRIPVTAPEAKDLITSNSVSYKITDNHSKVIAVVNDQWGVVINGSANMTINPRIEAGTVCTNRKVAEFTRDWIINEINHGKPFGR